MIHQASFSNFRGFKNLELDAMENITLISGRNNTGKSSVLEGIFLALDYKAPEAFAMLNDSRGISYNVKPEDLWDTLFHNQVLTDEINIGLGLEKYNLNLSYTRDDSFISSAAFNEPQNMLRQFISSYPQSYSLKFCMRYGDSSEEGHFIMNQQSIHRYSKNEQNISVSLPPAVYISSSRTINNAFTADLFGLVMRRNKKDRLIEYLKSIDSSISDITTITSGLQSQLFANINSTWLPFRLAGDGFDHMLIIIASMIAHPSSILLVDEIETGFHYSAYDKLWEAVILTAKEENCQIIATTHSYECLESAAAQAANNGIQNNFCYFRLGYNKHGEITSHRFSQELLSFAAEKNQEVR